MANESGVIAYYHLPGLFEFHDLYALFLPLFRSHREYFYSWCDIGSLYGAPAGSLWEGGRNSLGTADPKAVMELCRKYGVSARLTFSNSLLAKEHLQDPDCHALCDLFATRGGVKNGVIVSSDLLLHHLKERYPDLYLVSSTTKVLADFPALLDELNREEFSYVVPDFRLNKRFDCLAALNKEQKAKVEFLCNECCYPGCQDRKECYETVSRRSLGQEEGTFRCRSPYAKEGYRFSMAMANPSFIGIHDIEDVYAPMGFHNFKIEGRGLGSALILEFLLYYLTKPEYQLLVREAIYLSNELDLF